MVNLRIYFIDKNYNNKKKSAQKELIETNMEQETKNCPYCGEEIMATAKKCKHCGEWLTDRKKPNGKKANQPKVNVSETEHKGKVSSLRDDVRIANTQAEWNKENSNALPIQIIIIAIVIGIATKSWWIGAGVFMGVGFLLFIPYVGQLVCAILALLYAYIAYLLGSHFFSNDAGWVIAIFVGLGTLATNLSSRQWFNDIGEE